MTQQYTFSTSPSKLCKIMKLILEFSTFTCYKYLCSFKEEQNFICGSFNNTAVFEGTVLIICLMTYRLIREDSQCTYWFQSSIRDLAAAIGFGMPPFLNWPFRWAKREKNSSGVVKSDRLYSSIICRKQTQTLNLWCYSQLEYCICAVPMVFGYELWNTHLHVFRHARYQYQ